MKTQMALFTIFMFVSFLVSSFGLSATSATPQANDGFSDGATSGFFDPTFPDNMYEYAYMFGQGNWIQFPSQDVREKVMKSVHNVLVGVFDDQNNLQITPALMDIATDRIIVNGWDRTKKGTMFITFQNQFGVDLAYSMTPLFSDFSFEKISEVMAKAIPSRPLVKIVFPWKIEDGYNKEWKIIVTSLNGEKMDYNIDAYYDWDNGAAVSYDLFQTTPNPFILGLDQKINLEVALGAYVQGPSSPIYNATGEVIGGGCSGGEFGVFTPPNFNVSVTLGDTLGGMLIIADSTTPEPKVHISYDGEGIWTIKNDENFDIRLMQGALSAPLTLMNGINIKDETVTFSLIHDNDNISITAKLFAQAYNFSDGLRGILTIPTKQECSFLFASNTVIITSPATFRFEPEVTVSYTN